MAPPSSVEPASLVHDEALEFVRFCYRRRRVMWPELYDEMCNVAARGAFQGLGYSELSERGISFCLGEPLSRLAALAGRVVAEEQPPHEPVAVRAVPMMLVRSAARS
jgi:hypothetical protein